MSQKFYCSLTVNVAEGRDIVLDSREEQIAEFVINADDMEHASRIINDIKEYFVDSFPDVGPSIESADQLQEHIIPLSEYTELLERNGHDIILKAMRNMDVDRHP
ncbi:MAG: hypothetical protein D6732_02880 [Methanobacteriota archaeon]|nr:MAG: hypothetical protein D6732_02880 [Euryarchaeota archaeon]